MEIASLIISNNQIDSIPLIQSKLKNIPKKDQYWVLDRCTDDSYTLFNDENVIINNEGFGFLAGKMRDLGLDVILEKDYDYVIFLDGDRVPEKEFNLEQIREKMLLVDALQFSCTLFDYREHDFIYSTFLYSKLVSCGMVIKTTVLKKVRKMKIMEGRCFHSAFDGRWGAEDNFLGVVLHCLGNKIGFTTDIKVKGPLEGSSTNININQTQIIQALSSKLISLDSLKNFKFIVV